MTHFQQLANLWVSKLAQNGGKRIYVDFSHIKEIDGVLVDINMKLEEPTTGIYTYMCDITDCIVGIHNDDECQSNHTYFCKYETLDSFEEFVCSIERLYSILKNIKMDYYDCTFKICDSKSEEEMIRSCFHFSDCDNVKLHGDKCSVCYEITKMKTTCGHHICVPCADRTLVKTHPSKCPVCRENNALEYLIQESTV